MHSPRIRHRNQLTERNWVNAVQGLANLGIQLKADYELFNSVSGNMVLMQGRIFGGGGVIRLIDSTRLIVSTTWF